MPDVPGVLPDDVYVNPAQRHLAQLVVRHRLVQREARCDLPGYGAGALILGDDAADGLAGGYVPARGVAAGVPGDLLARLAAEVVLEPVALHGSGVADQAEHGSR